MSTRCVIQEHHATHLHYDVRLEMDGALRSWTIPKGPSMNPSEKRVAVQVEDHNLDYINFEGIIPAGYGAGAVVIWDNGTYELLDNQKERMSFSLNGRKLKGKFTLISLKGRGKDSQWLLIKQKDEFTKTDWKLKPCLIPEKMAQLKEKIPPCQSS